MRHSWQVRVAVAGFCLLGITVGVIIERSSTLTEACRFKDSTETKQKKADGLSLSKLRASRESSSVAGSPIVVPVDSGDRAHWAQIEATDPQRDETTGASVFELLDAKSAQGRPFPVSLSVTTRCAREKPADVSCEAVNTYVRSMQLEPRDLSWARNREERLEKAIDSFGPGRFEIRSLECRTNRCAAEVVGVGEVLPPNIVGDSELEHELISGPTTFAFERGQNGETLVVTVMGYKRRSVVQIKDGRLIGE